MSEPQLSLAAKTAVERLGVGAGDRFLVCYDASLAAIADALAQAARSRTEAVAALEFVGEPRHGAEPPVAVASAFGQADAIALVTRYSLSHTRARLAASERGARVASLPDITEDIFARTVPVDYGELERVGRALAAKLSAATRCRIVSAAGTDVELSLAGRDGRSDDGDLVAPGAFGNLPAGEAYIAPFEQAGEGTIVFDGSLASWGLLVEPLRIGFSGGRATEFAGGEAADWLAETLAAGGEGGTVIAELGIGTNPAARIGGKILEDEKVEGTVHLAFGTNTGIGGANQSSVHIDGLICGPTVELDGTVIMRDGQLLER